MSKTRNTWIGLSVVLAVLLVGLSTRPRGSDQAAAQLTSATTTAALGCNRCPWSYRYVKGPVSGGREREQILPPGTSGVLHRLHASSGVLYVGEGDANNPNAPLIGNTGTLTSNVDLDLAFTDGLWIELDFSGTCTMLYRLGCIRCPWSYKLVDGAGRFQIVPPGTSGVLHRLCSNWGAFAGEGDANNPNAPLIVDVNNVDLDLAFTDGLWIGFNQGGTCTTLYRLDSPISAGSIESSN